MDGTEQQPGAEVRYETAKRTTTTVSPSSSVSVIYGSNYLTRGMLNRLMGFARPSLALEFIGLQIKGV